MRISLSELFKPLFIGPGTIIKRREKKPPVDGEVPTNLPEANERAASNNPPVANSQPTLQVAAPEESETLPIQAPSEETTLPSYTQDDIAGKTVQETAQFLLTTYENELLEIVDTASLRERKAINLLFRLTELGDMAEFKEIAIMPEDRNAENRKIYYTPLSASTVEQQPLKDLEAILIKLEVEEPLAIETVRQLSSNPEYKIEDEVPVILSMKDKVKLTEPQDKVRILFRETAQLDEGANRNDLNGAINSFLAVGRGSSISKLSSEELQNRIEFLEMLTSRKPRYMHRRNSNLASEFNAYKKYNKAEDGHKSVADTFVNGYSEPRLNTYDMRKRVVEFLANEQKSGNSLSSLDFLSELATLRDDYDVEGTDRLLGKAHKYSKDNAKYIIDGIYYEASVAISLANNSEITVHAVSVEEVSLGEDESMRVGDIDILASRDNQLYDIEVKTTVNAAHEEQDQINRNVETAYSHGSIPVLLAGNIQAISTTVDRFIYNPLEREEMLEVSSRRSDLDQAIKITEILDDPKNDGLQIWNENGTQQSRILTSAKAYQGIMNKRVA